MEPDTVMTSQNSNARGSGRTSLLQRFMASEAAGGIVLLAASVLALIIANSPWAAAYFETLQFKLGGLSLLHWINDGLMAIFFLLVGLEVKREFLAGQLSRWDQRVLPGVAAVAGMAVPAAIFVLFNLRTQDNLAGWAIPAATDIAFALGILALLGPRVPLSVKVLLTVIAIIDDLLAILVIALFYTGEIAMLPLSGAFAGIALLAVLNRSGVQALWPYLLIGAGVWLGVLLSGVHATLAGVAVALAIPLRTKAGPAPLLRLEHAIHGWVAFLIIPVFGLANAGVSFAGLSPSDLLAPLPVGIALGLFLGKQLGIFSTIWVMVRLRLAPQPEQASWRHLYGMSLLCGIGFTMSLFIGGLAFGDDAARLDAVKIGVLAGSLLSGIAGYWLLRRQ